MSLARRLCLQFACGHSVKVVLKMKKVFISFVLVVALLPNAVTAQEWITEEVLKQLSEIRQELKVLQDEVRGLKGELANRPSAPSAAAARKAITLDISKSPSIGAKGAQIAIVEFSDYQCPYCKRHFSQTLPDIEKNYVDTGKVQYVMKQFPLGFHAKARGASIAALCVDKLKPGSYWKAHEAISGGSTKLDTADYLALAASLELNQSKYQKCLDDPQMSTVVDQDLADGGSVGVSGTPAFLVGKIVDGKVVDGQLITGARPYASFSQLIDKLLSSN